MKIGYARVSTADQKLDVQLDQLKSAGCNKLFTEKVSGKDAVSRSELASALDFVREGDCLVVTKLDRLARSAVDLGRIAEMLEQKKVDLVVLNQAIDTSTPTGRLMFTMIGAFAEFERNLIRERCAEGIERAKANGTKFGRKKVLSDKQLTELRAEYEKASSSRVELAKRYGISKASLYRLARV
ncbi:recombinase family protein [Dasania marina]|uniref:recombinase family protein n=1 Tax=Dasania marina TaxID=471499 RepID=UPI0030DB285B|tara:strand:+ start:71530 stop:72081 length:552 start_codon:yes stop_codon:yes gene_type:complete